MPIAATNTHQLTLSPAAAVFKNIKILLDLPENELSKLALISHHPKIVLFLCIIIHAAYVEGCRDLGHVSMSHRWCDSNQGGGGDPGTCVANGGPCTRYRYHQIALYSQPRQFFIICPPALHDMTKYSVYCCLCIEMMALHGSVMVCVEVASCDGRS